LLSATLGLIVSEPGFQLAGHTTMTDIRSNAIKHSNVPCFQHMLRNRSKFTVLTLNSRGRYTRRWSNSDLLHIKLGWLTYKTMKKSQYVQSSWHRNMLWMNIRFYSHAPQHWLMCVKTNTNKKLGYRWQTAWLICANAIAWLSS